MPSPTPPADVIRAATVTLHGLSFGEHDSGAQREALTLSLGAILERWTSGLLAADAPAHVDAARDAFEALLTSPPAPELLLWRLLPLPVLDDVVAIFWRRAAALLTELPDGAEPAACDSARASDAARALRAARVVLDAAAGVNRRSAAANTAPGHAVFAAVRLRLSLESYPCDDADEIRGECDAVLASLQRMRRVKGVSQLVASTFKPTLYASLQRAIDTEAALTNPSHVLTQLSLAPAPAVLHEVLQLFTDVQRLETLVRPLLDMLAPLLEHVFAPTRTQSLATLALLTARLPEKILRRHTDVVSCIRGSLLWNDPATSHLAIPLLQTWLKFLQPVPPAIRDRVPDEWGACLGRVLSTLIAHMTARKDEPGTRTPSVPDARIAVELAGLVPDMFGQALLPHAERWMSMLAEFLTRVTTMLTKNLMCIDDIVVVCDVMKESMRWVWLRADGFRKQVFRGCMEAALEVRPCDVETRDIVRTLIRGVLVCLARCAAPESTLVLIREMRRTAEEYPSLADAADFFAGVEAVVEADGDKGEPVYLGDMVHRFFPQLSGR